MHFYSMSYREVMSLPIRTFWLLDMNIDRIRSQADLRHLAVAVSSQSGESSESRFKELREEVGTIVELEIDPIKSAVRDSAGFEELRAMAG